MPPNKRLERTAGKRAAAQRQTVRPLIEAPMTQRYMHLSPSALDAAIRLLETGTDTSRAAVEQ